MWSIRFTKLMIYPLSESANHCQQTKVKCRLFFVALCKTEFRTKLINTIHQSKQNQQGKKSNIQMVRWKQLKQGVRLSIQPRLVVEHRVQSKMLEDWPFIAQGFPTLFSRVTINTMKNCRIPVKKYFLAARLGQG